MANEWYCKKQFLSFWRQRATSHNEHITNVLFSFPTWEHTVHRHLVSKKIGKCDGGIEPGLWALVHLNGQWFGQDSFWLKKEAINLNAMHILNSYSVRSLFSNFLYTVKDLTRATLNRSKNKQRQNRNFDLRSSWYADFSWSIKSTPPILLLYNFMQFGQFIEILDEEPFNLLCTVDIDVTSSKWLPSSITDLPYHLIQAMWLQNLHW